jgi:PAS domain S-box-containing protein
MLFFTLLFGSFLLFRMNNLNQNIDKFYNHPYIVIKSIGDLKSEVSNINHWLDHYVHTSNENDIVIYKEIKKRDSLASINVKTIIKYSLNKKSNLENLDKSYADYSAFVNEALEFRKNKNFKSARELLRNVEEVKSNHLFLQINGISNFSNNKADELYVKTLKNSRERLKYFWIGFFVLFIINVFVSLYISKSITNPIKKFIVDLNNIYKKNEDLVDIDILTGSEDKILDQTISEIKDTYDKLREFNENLEQKVLLKSEELKVVEQKFKLLFEKSADALFLLENGVFVDCNESGVKLLGYTSKDEFLNVHPSAVSPKSQPNGNNSLDEELKNIQKALNEGSIRFKWVHKKYNGELFPAEVLLTTIVNEPDNYVIYCVVRDISLQEEADLKLKEAKQKAEESEEFLNNIINKMIDPVFVKDSQSRLIIVNDAFCKLFNLTENEILGKTLAGNVTPEEMETSLNIDKEVIISGNDSILEETITIRNGETKNILTRKSRFIDEYGKIFLVGIITDITSLKNTETALTKAKNEAEQSWSFLENIINNIGDPVFVKDEESKYVIVNDAFCKKFKISREELLESTEIKNIQKSENETYLKIDKQVLETGEEIINNETMTLKGEEPKNILTRKTRYVDSDGDKYIVGVITDITDLKNIEHELIKAKEKAEESEQLKSAFLANMSHEIRTPMNAILGFTSLLNDKKLDETKRYKFMRLIDDAGKRLLSIISDIVDVSKIDVNQLSINYNSYNLNEIIDSLCLQFSIQLPSNKIKLITNKGLDDNKSFIETDKTRLVQVLSNLIENALKFTEEGSVTFGYEVTSNLLKFHVKDTGIGINDHDKTLIFERFTQVNQNYLKATEGTGLGLAIAKGIIDSFGGTIWVEDNETQGTIINFEIPYLPASIPLKKEKAFLKPINVNSSGYKYKVLVAEDELTNFIFIREVLKHYDVEILHAENGKIAVELFQEHKNIDLVFMDIKMPVMDGYDATLQIRDISSTVPIIAITAYAMAEDETRALKAGCNEYVSKPTSKWLLNNLIGKYLKIHELN